MKKFEKMMLQIRDLQIRNYVLICSEQFKNTNTYKENQAMIYQRWENERKLDTVDRAVKDNAPKSREERGSVSEDPRGGEAINWNETGFITELFYEEVLLSNDESKNNKFRHPTLALDIELTESQFVVGVYFKHTKKYAAIYIDSSCSGEDFQIAKDNLAGLLYSMSKTPEEMGVESLLCTYNGSAYDLKVLSFYFTKVKTPKQIKELWSYSDILIYKNKELQKDQKYRVKNVFSLAPLKEGILHIDTLNQLVPRGEFSKNSLGFYKYHLTLTTPSKEEIPDRVDFLPYEPVVKSYKTAKKEPLDVIDWLFYNKNDLIYTLEIFVRYNGAEFLESRKEFSSNSNSACSLAGAVSLTNAQLATALHNAPSLIPPTEEKLKKGSIRLGDLVFPNYYSEAFPVYAERFKTVIYSTRNPQVVREEKESPSNLQYTLPDGKGILNFSLGGLHSEHQNPVLFNSNNSNDCYVDLDVQSFYTNLLIQICDLLNLTSLGKVLTALNEDRVRLKKANPILSGINKVIILSITGNLNQPFSIFYSPLLYFSMTANGQLFLSEFLFKILPFTENLLYANTDGLAIKVRKENIRKLDETIAYIQNEYKLLFDSKMYIKRGILFHVNQYIFLLEDGTTRIKGFTSNSLSILPFVYEWIVVNDNELQSFDSISPVHLCSALVVASTLETISLNMFLGYASRLGLRKFFYFSKEPTCTSGFCMAGVVFQSERPTCEFTLSDERNFAKQIQNGEYLEAVKFDLCFFSYYLFLLADLNRHRKKTKLPEYQLTIHPEVFNNSFTFSFGINGQTTASLDPIKPWFYEQPIIKTARFLAYQGAWVFPKNVDKKNFSGVPSVGKFFNIHGEVFSFSKTSNTSCSSIEHFWGSLKAKPQIWFKAPTLAIDVKNSFPIVVLDFDQLEFLFNPRNFYKTQRLLGFLISLKNLGLVIFSSPTEKYPIRRFKVIFKVSGFVDQPSFTKNFVNKVQEIGINIAYEDSASLYGMHFKNLPLTTNFFTKFVRSNTNIPQYSENYLHQIFLAPANSEKQSPDNAKHRVFKQLARFFEPWDNEPNPAQDKYDIKNLFSSPDSENQEIYFEWKNFRVNQPHLFNTQSFRGDYEPLRVNLFLNSAIFNPHKNQNSSLPNYHRYFIATWGVPSPQKPPANAGRYLLNFFTQQIYPQLPGDSLSSSLNSKKTKTIVPPPPLVTSTKQNFPRIEGVAKNFEKLQPNLDRIFPIEFKKGINIKYLLVLKSLLIFLKQNHGLEVYTIKDPSGLNLQDIHDPANTSLIQEFNSRPDYTKQIHLQGKCIFKDDKDLRIVNIFIAQNYINIYCHHDSCVKYNAYLPIRREINSYYKSLQLLHQTHPFELIECSVEEVFSSLFLQDYS